ncbi:MAG TPA: HlyC/CorC family transporter [Desulfobacterales bacterium]|nr:HlyC/CorC family transporter [Desulfobacterales bacterium]
MDKEPPQERQEPSSLRRLLHFLGIGRIESADELEHELQELIEEGEKHGLLSPDEGLMITGVLDLKDTLVREIMTPRTEMVTIEEDASMSETIERIRQEGYSRLPVQRGTPDQIVGTVHAKDLLLALDDPAATPVKELAKPAFFVSETDTVADLLKLFQREHAHLAIVTDEFGVTRGLVTLEDALEEIVGEITDEHDDEEPNLRPVDSSTVLADGRTRIEEVEAYFNVNLPEGPYDTIGGLITHQLGRIPQPGARLSIPPLVFTTVLASKRRVISVRISRTAADTAT